MFSLPKILVPVDLSESSTNATRYAAALASHFHSELILLHAFLPSAAEFSGFEGTSTVIADLYAHRKEQEEKSFNSFMRAELEPLHPKRMLMEGDPAQAIVSYAHAEKIDLIVMSTRGYGQFRRFILGSVTAKVLHDAQCPVFTGVHLEHAPAPEKIDFRNILCAIDLGPQSSGIIAWAAQMAGECDGRVTIFHAIPALEASAAAHPEPDWSGMLMSQARQRILQLQDQIGIQAQICVASGDVSGALRVTAQNHRANLVVIGRSPEAGFLGRLRTNAYAIIRESPCPVVSV